LLGVDDDLAVSLVKFHVFSTIGIGAHNPGLAMTPPEWVEFCDRLHKAAPGSRAFAIGAEVADLAGHAAWPACMSGGPPRASRSVTADIAGPARDPPVRS
jgi:hypothetical protein